MTKELKTKRVIETTIRDPEYLFNNLLLYLSGQLSDGYWENDYWHEEFWNYLDIYTTDEKRASKRHLVVEVSKKPTWDGVTNIFSSMTDEEVIHYIGEVLEEAYEVASSVFTKVYAGVAREYISYEDDIDNVVKTLKEYKHVEIPSNCTDMSIELNIDKLRKTMKKTYPEIDIKSMSNEDLIDMLFKKQLKVFGIKAKKTKGV